MTYFKARKEVVIEHHLALDHFGKENSQTNVYLRGFLPYISCKHVLMNLTSFMSTPNSMRILYTISLLTESKAFFEVYE
jgi:hypothetical protein